MECWWVQATTNQVDTHKHTHTHTQYGYEILWASNACGKTLNIILLRVNDHKLVQLDDVIVYTKKNLILMVGKRCCLGWQFLKEERKAWEIHLSSTLGEGPTFQIWAFICNLATLGDYCCSPFFFQCVWGLLFGGGFMHNEKELVPPMPPYLGL